METITEPVTDSITDRYGIPRYAGHTMTKADFLRWESDDNYVYEFNNGVLEPTTGMRLDEILLFKQITRRFARTEAYGQGDELLAEIDIWLLGEQMRRPDVSFFTSEQLQQAGAGTKVVPNFVIEFASNSDTELKTITKRHEYFAAGVQVLWWVYPLYQEVFVYTSPKTVTICTDDDVLSAAPVLPDLQMTVAELFRQ